MEVIAHRGFEHTPETLRKVDGTPVVDDAGRPVVIFPTYDENSIGSLTAAAIAGFDVEFDVRRTAEGIGVVSHDDVLKNDEFSLSIERSSLGVLQRAGLVNTSRQRDGVPLLTDVLESLLERKQLHMELKDRGSAEAARKSIGLLGFREQHIARSVTVSSFLTVELMEFRSFYPSVRLAWLRGETQVDSAQHIQRIITEGGIGAVHLSLPMATPEVVRWFTKDVGVDVRVFTVNDPTIAVNLWRMKAEHPDTGQEIPVRVAGIFTDYPRTMLQVLQ